MLSLFNGTFLEACTIQPAWAVNQDANANITGDRINLKNYDGCAVVVWKPAGTANDDLLLNFLQCTAATGGSTKDFTVNVKRIWFNLATTNVITAPKGWVYGEITTPAATIDLHALAAVCFATESSAYAVGDAIGDLTSDIVDTLFVMDVKPSDMDTNNSYTWLELDSAGSAVANACLCNAFYIPYGAKFGKRAPLTIVA